MVIQSAKRCLSVILSAALLIGAAAGCAQQAPQQAPSSAAPAPQASSGAPASSEPGFGEKDPASYSGTLTVWAFTDEMKQSNFISEFNKVYPNVTVNYVVTPTDNNAYQTKLAAALTSGAGAPDVFLSEIGFLKSEVDTPYVENLSDAPYNAEELVKGHMADYAVDLGRNSSDNTIRALTWQATPGGIFYRRSLAKQYFGTDDPEQVSEMMNSFDKIIDMGATLNSKSGGKVKMLSTYKDLFNIANGSKSQPWVADDKLVIDQKLLDYADVAKKARDSKIDLNADSWSSPWSASMVDDTVFAYVLPSWGIGVINSFAPKTEGDWGLAQAPVPYFNGGTWASIYGGSQNKELAWLFVKYITTDPDFLTYHCKTYSDYVNNLDVDEQFANSDDGNSAFCGGQNIFKTYNELLPKISGGKLVTKYDTSLNSAFQTDLDLYVNNKCSKDEFIQKFRQDVQAAFPDVDTAG